MLLLVGQVARGMRGREAFQEVDYEAMFGPLAKWACEIHEVERIPELVARAYSVAMSGRPGPVVLALPEDLLVEEADVEDAPRAAPVQAHPGPEELARHLTDEQHERRGVLHRRVHAGRGVRRPRAARHHAHAGAAGQLAVGVRGVRGRRFVATRDDAQPVAMGVEPVEERQIALARHAERKLHVVQGELVGKQLPAAPGSRTHSWTGSSRNTV